MEQQHTAKIERLLELTRAPLRQHDLEKLAQLHTCFQALTEADSRHARLAATVVDFLEAVILSEAGDAVGGLALIPEAMARMQMAPAGAPTEHEDLCARIRTATSPKAPANTEVIGQAHGMAPLRIDAGALEHVRGFIDEAWEHIDAIETTLSEIDGACREASVIDALFRPIHTIKGIAGFLNLRDIGALTHEMESLLQQGRRNELVIDPDVVDLIWLGTNFLKQQVAQLAAYVASPTGECIAQPDIGDVVQRLRSAGRWQGAAPRRTGGGAAEPTSSGAASDPPVGRVTAPNTIRIDSHKLDALVDAVGELVIAQTSVNLSEALRTDATLSRRVALVTKIVREIQDQSMSLRMAPIGPMLQRMKPLVRDLAQKAGKRATLVISGEQTELDKNVIQSISDPLVHLLRNAVDHGLESPAERVAQGKAASGTIGLHVAQRGDKIVIQVSDDGRGLDPARLREKALELGFISSGQTLSAAQAHELVFVPGVSTAATVTEISGRGVGMDVVRRNVEALRGRVDISTESGVGSTFSIEVPLTLAILDGMLVRVGGERLIVPIHAIELALRPAPDQLARMQQKELLRVGGEWIPLIQLGGLFGGADALDPSAAMVVVARAKSQIVGLVVDEMVGQQQFVVKPLAEPFQRVCGVSGATILGDGLVGLILDPGRLIEHFRTRPVGVSFGNAAAPTADDAALAREHA